MSIKKNDEFSRLTSEQKKAVAKEAELSRKIYDWFNNIGSTNKSAAAKIQPQDLQKRGELTVTEANDIESRTGESGLSDLVKERELVRKKIFEGWDELSKLWLKIIKNLTT